jgi:hypothetical protein
MLAARSNRREESHDATRCEDGLHGQALARLSGLALAAACAGAHADITLDPGRVSEVVDAITDELTPVLFDALEPLGATRREEARQVLERLRKGEIDPARFTPDALAWFKPQTLRDFAASLMALGPLRSLKLSSQQTRGGMDYREYSAEFDTRKLTLTTRSLPDGRLEQFMLGL